MYFLQTTPFLPPQALKQAPAATVTPSKELPAADQLVHTPTQLAQDPVRQLDLSATDSPRSALGSPLSEMSGYKLFSHEKVVLEERHVNPMLLKCLEDDVDIPGPSTPIYTDWFSSTHAPDIWNIAIPEGKQKGRPPVTSAPPHAMRSTSAPLQKPSEPPSPVAAAPNWSATLIAAVTAGLQENATKQRQYEVGNL